MAMFFIFMKVKSSYPCHSENGFSPHCVETVFLHSFLEICISGT